MTAETRITHLPGVFGDFMGVKATSNVDSVGNHHLLLLLYHQSEGLRDQLDQ